MITARPFLPLLLGICVFASPHVTRAQVQASDANPPRLFRRIINPEWVWVNEVAPDYLVAKLRAIIGRTYPDTKIETENGTVTVFYRSKRFDTHLIDSKNEFSAEGPEKFPADFDEFWLQVHITDLPYSTVIAQRWEIRPESFGNSLVRRVELRPSPFLEGQVNGHGLEYNFYDALVDAGLVAPFDHGKNLFRPNFMNRRQFAEAAIRARAGINARQKAKGPVLSTATLTALGKLESIFSIDIEALTGQTNPQKVQPLAGTAYVRFFYGQGVRKQLVEDVKRVFST